MFIKTCGFMQALPPVNGSNVKKNEEVGYCSKVYDKGQVRIMCKSVRTGIWHLAKIERLSNRRVK